MPGEPVGEMFQYPWVLTRLSSAGHQEGMAPTIPVATPVCPVLAALVTLGQKGVGTAFLQAATYYARLCWESKRLKCEILILPCISCASYASRTARLSSSTACAPGAVPLVPSQSPPPPIPPNHQGCPVDDATYVLGREWRQFTRACSPR